MWNSLFQAGRSSFARTGALAICLLCSQAEAQDPPRPAESAQSPEVTVDEALLGVDQTEIVQLSRMCVVPSGRRCETPKAAEPGTRCRCGRTRGRIR